MIINVTRAREFYKQTNGPVREHLKTNGGFEAFLTLGWKSWIRTTMRTLDVEDRILTVQETRGVMNLLAKVPNMTADQALNVLVSMNMRGVAQESNFKIRNRTPLEYGILTLKYWEHLFR